MDEIARSVDGYLRSFLDEVVSSLPESEPLVGAIGDLITSGGKRLRPRFCYWGYRTVAFHRDEIVRAAAALELLHTFALIHDDIMDRSPLRRGRATVHAEHGPDFAILAGDLALVLADRAFFAAGFDDATTMAAFAPYSRMRQEVIAGQFLDVAAGSNEMLDEATARHIAVMKSGRYSVEMPLVIGATLGGAAPEQLDVVAAFGAPLGEAFQLHDDLLGSFGFEEHTGKPSDSDVREGKRNFLYAAAMARLDGQDRAFFSSRWGGGDDLDDGDVGVLRSLLESSGARAATEDLLDGLRAEAEARLPEVPGDDEVRASLARLLAEATGIDQAKMKRPASPG